MLNTLSVMAVITNAFLVAFSSSWLYERMLEGVARFDVTVCAMPRAKGKKKTHATVASSHCFSLDAFLPRIRISSS